MKHARDINAGAPVGHLSDLPGLSRLVIGCLRHWNSGGAAAALAMLRARMAETRACATFDALQDLTEVLGPHIRRPLRCHAPGCDCVGLDEASFACFVEEAAMGEREEAMLLASILVTPRGILPLTDAAARLGLTLHRALLCDQRVTFRDPASQTRH